MTKPFWQFTDVSVAPSWRWFDVDLFCADPSSSTWDTWPWGRSSIECHYHDAWQLVWLDVDLDHLDVVSCCFMELSHDKPLKMSGTGRERSFQHLPTSSSIFQLLQRHPYSRKFEPNAINHPQNHHFSGCYKPSPNGRFMALAFPQFYLLDHRPIRSQFLDGLGHRHQTCQSWEICQCQHMPTMRFWT